MHPLPLLEEVVMTHHPTPCLSNASPLTEEEKIEKIAEAFRTILHTLELDLSHPSLSQTPRRVAEMYVKELFIGLKKEAFPKICFLDNDFLEPAEGIVIVKKIDVNSICEHHFLPFIGKAQIAYLPRHRVLGLSKLNRLVHYFCHRPQLQERLTAQIADALSLLLETEDVAVAIEATHQCVTLRGICDKESTTYTQVLRGAFQERLRHPFDARGLIDSIHVRGAPVHM